MRSSGKLITLAFDHHLKKNVLCRINFFQSKWIIKSLENQEKFELISNKEELLQNCLSKESRSSVEQGLPLIFPFCKEPLRKRKSCKYSPKITHPLFEVEWVIFLTLLEFSNPLTNNFLRVLREIRDFYTAFHETSYLLRRLRKFQRGSISSFITIIKKS